MEKEEENDVTARFLLEDFDSSLTEEDFRSYFQDFGELEEVTLKEMTKTGKLMGSVKFAHPTWEIRDSMLKEPHTVNGQRITVQTHKMRKMAKPGYAERRAATREDRKAAKGGSKGGPHGCKGGNARASAGWDAIPWDVSAGGPHRGTSSGKGAYPGYGAAGMGYDYGPAGKGYGYLAPAGRGYEYAPYGCAPGHGMGCWDAYGTAAYGWGPGCYSYGGRDFGPAKGYGYSKGAVGPYGGCQDPYGGRPPASHRGMPSSGGKGGKSDRGGKASGKKERAHEDSCTSRFIMTDLPDGATEDDVREYFQVFGDIEEVTMKQLTGGQITGSVKFTDPNPELRATMLDQPHTIHGQTVTVQTHKMMKHARQAQTGRPGRRGKGGAAGDAGNEHDEEGREAEDGSFEAGDGDE